ncbi:cystatin-like [Ascaphus truei]|uniref:cystatin-like n=1 Tax=Ascaphus truei TaxID=8439 RepID=UPI003F5AD9D9
MAMLVSALVVVMLVVASSGSPDREGGQRPRSLVGAPIEAQKDEEGVQRALMFAMKEYNKGSNDKYVSKVANVINVKKQIVSGVNYLINVEIGRTTCTKPTYNLGECEFHEQPADLSKLICNFEVWNVPWLGQTKLTKNECH